MIVANEVLPAFGEKIIRAYKLFRVRKDGSLGSLFIARRERLPVGKWLQSEVVPTKGFAVRPGWHACSEPRAPHLSEVGRKWFEVEILAHKEHLRPESQGGLWYTAIWMRIVRPV